MSGVKYNNNNNNNNNNTKKEEKVSRVHGKFGTNDRRAVSQQ